ncbi:hypothetical protein ACOSP7_023608 [Xanthoceras sorbifolium]
MLVMWLREICGGGLKLAWNSGFKNVIMETDSQTIVDILLQDLINGDWETLHNTLSLYTLSLLSRRVHFNRRHFRLRSPSFPVIQ